ncbi:T9SS type A sorting domain-containing protein [Flavobacterium sp. F372]|uniref:T9SS type A sorting domain-containing protein n=1 Tax=Flavobacterium bernardetii TaxID=2813823 RepID=UPI00140B99D6|nr:T9SS type A sorting domain-containing protein [Flavobacterium bernardetii]NHF71464.1 T9SS type A sorting domain-containing protein [Flavobacterium bernardetii]
MKKIYISLLLLGSINTHSQCFTKIESGNYHLTALKSDGTLWGWGFSNWGQLNSTPMYPFAEPVPLQLDAATNWQSMANGGNNSFAIKTNGTLWATGGNNYGTLGINSTIPQIQIFTQVGTANWKAISASGEHVIGIQTNGTLWAWGRNDYNQVGNNTCCSDVLAPVQISTDTDWATIDTSIWGYTIALKTNGTLWGWGKNEGAFGGSMTTSLAVPTQLSTDTDWAEISTLGSHILMVKTNGTLWVFGGGGTGALGLGSGVTTTYIPLQVGTDNWKSIAGGFFTSFAVKTDGTLWVWGRNDGGQLGLGDTTNRNIPTQIGTDTNWTKVITGRDHTIAIKNDGTAYAWGYNNFASTTLGTFVPAESYYTPILLPTAMNGVCAVLENEGFNIPTNDIILAPNPTKELTTLKFATIPENTTVTVYNLLGTKMDSFSTTEQTAYTIDTRQYSAGMYIVVVATINGTTQQFKLIKE